MRMNNFELHEQAEQMAVGKSAYKLARRIIELEQSQSKMKAEAVRNAVKQLNNAERFDDVMINIIRPAALLEYANKLEKGEV
jgi:hypothetical protein